MMHHQSRAAARTLLFTTAIGLVLAVPELALAQTGAPKAPAESSTAVQEVVVTAQKRTENLQSVPISVEVVSGVALAADNQNNLVDLSDKLPGIQVRAGPGTTKLYVRGVGSGTGSGFDQSVGVFVDGIYHGRSKGDISGFLDVDRVEILKGPQSIFFGNSAIAGAISVTSTKADKDNSGYVRALYGQYGQYAFEGAVGTPLGGGFGIRVAAVSNGQTGWMKNTVTGETEPNLQNFTGRATLTYDHADDFDAALKIEHGQRRQVGVLMDQINNCPAPPAFPANAGFCGLAQALGVPLNPNGNNYADTPGENLRLDNDEVVLNANYHKWGHTFSSVTGYYDYSYNQQYDPTGTPTTTNGLGVQNPEGYHQFSQEFRVTSPTGKPLEYIAGVYYQTDHLGLGAEQNLFSQTGTVSSKVPALAPFTPIGQNIVFGQNEKIYAAFASLTWNITSNLKVSGGLRQSKVDKNYSWLLYYGTATSEYSGLVPLPASVAALPGNLGLGIPGTQHGSRSDQRLTPSFRVQYQFQPQVMAYFSYAEGFKAGGFVGNPNNATGTLTANPNSIDFAAEHVKAYEVGLKSKWFDNRVLLNLAAFRSDYRNLQVAQNQPTTNGNFVSNVTNAGSSLAQGVEFEAQWVIDEHFRMTTAGSYLDSHYVDYAGDGLGAAKTLAYNQCVAANGANGKVACAGIATQNLAGQDTILAPRWSGNITGTYQTLLPHDYNLKVNLTGIYSTSYQLEATDDPLITAPGYIRIDAGVTVESPDRRWAFDVIGKNLNNEIIRTFGSQLSGSVGSQLIAKEAPRTISAQLRYRW